MADESVSAVHTLGRRELALKHAKLTQHVVDFRALPPLPAVDEVYLALGTTIRVAGSQEAFRNVDFETNMAVARAARANGATKVGAVSAMGAAAGSPVFYNRVKGELEDALVTLGYATVVIARPSFLNGDRESLGQPVRPGEGLALKVSQWLRPLIPANYRSIEAAKVARALLRAMPSSTGRRVLLSGEMQKA